LSIAIDNSFHISATLTTFIHAAIYMFPAHPAMMISSKPATLSLDKHCREETKQNKLERDTDTHTDLEIVTLPAFFPTLRQ
jgi:hypothetical protein